MDDSRIIELFFARNEQAIEETKEKYGKYCFKIAYNILANREDAEECENDAYLAVWNTVPPTKPKVFSAFIGRITRNLSLKKLREKTAAKRQACETLISLEELEGCIPNGKNFADELDERELAKLLNSFLFSLNATERNIFIRRYWYCDSIKDICGRYGFGQSKVKMMLLRTRKQLLTYLNERGVFI